MTSVASRSARFSPARASLAVLALIMAACGTGDKKTDTTGTASSAAPAAAAPPAASSSTAKGSATTGGGMGQMANMTGDADHDFLRMMSDHHKGLIVLAHMTKDRKDAGAAVADAKKLDAAQDKELDHMMTMLEKDFKDAYAPKVMPEHQDMADKLKAKSGKDYERTFYQSIIAHHREALTMIDEYLPKARNAMLKQMAEKMKADQTKEISDFERKVSKLGAQ